MAHDVRARLGDGKSQVLDKVIGQPQAPPRTRRARDGSPTRSPAGPEASASRRWSSAPSPARRSEVASVRCCPWNVTRPGTPGGVQPNRGRDRNSCGPKDDTSQGVTPHATSARRGAARRALLGGVGVGADGLGTPPAAVVPGARGQHRGNGPAGRGECRRRATSPSALHAPMQRVHVEQLADRVAQPAALGLAAASSTNGRRTQLSTFSCTTSLDSAKLAAASAGSSAFGIGACPRALTAVPASSAP